MTRKQEIEEMAKTTASHITSDKDMQVAFADALRRGAQWADQHPVNYDGKAMLYVNNRSHENGYKEAVEKACEWLGENFRVSSFDDTKIVTHFSNMYDLEDDFRKAMKRE